MFCFFSPRLLNYKFVCRVTPSVLIFLTCAIPCIWLLELKLLCVRLTKDGDMNNSTFNQTEQCIVKIERTSSADSADMDVSTTSKDKTAKIGKSQNYNCTEYWFCIHFRQVFDYHQKR